MRVHAVGNAHIDPVWRWRWQEGCAEVLQTCRAAVELLDEYPGMVFSRGQAATFAWVQEHDPPLFARIRELVQAGRWEVVNGWWEQPDANVPCGESFVRHSLYGKRWFREHLGVDVTVGWNVDTFGHTAGLPQILARAGFTSYCFFRPGSHEKELPAPFFWWQADDGSRVLAVRPPTGHYGTGGGDLTDAVVAAAERARDLGMEHAVLFYGIGNHGGGPTRRNLASLEAASQGPGAPDARPSSVAAFIDAITPLADRFPTVTGDLQHHAPGCYTTHGGVKQWNRDAEVRLMRAERWAAVASLVGGAAPPTAQVEQAWRQVLFCQFHDILAGTSVPRAYDDVRDQLGEACAIAARAENRALLALAARADTRPPAGVADAVPALLFSPSATRRADPASVQWGWGARPGGRLLDETGAEVPVQEAQPDLFGGAVRIVFEPEMPAHGWRTFHWAPGPPTVTPDDAPSAGATWVQNRHWRLDVDPGTGALDRLTDRALGIDVLRAGACALVVMADAGDTWGHDIAGWRDEVGRFGAADVRVVESGPVFATLRVDTQYGKSTARQDFTVYRQSPRIDISLTVDWRERHRFLKLAVPTAISGARLTAGAAYACIEREQSGLEDPFHGWLDLSGTVEVAGTPRAYGVSLLAPGRYGYDCLDGEVRLSLLRSPIYCFHDPARVEPGRDYLYMDQGVHMLRYALLPHSGTWRDIGTPQESLAFEAPPQHVFQYPHEGAAGPLGSLVDVSPGSVLVASLKGAEDGEGLVLRLWESRGEATHARITLAGRQFDTDLGPWELKTLRLRPSGAIEATSLLE